MKQTTKSLLTALVVLGVAAAIGGAALWVTKDTEKQAAQKERSAKLFDGLDKSKVRPPGRPGAGAGCGERRPGRARGGPPAAAGAAE